MPVSCALWSEQGYLIGSCPLLRGEKRGKVTIVHMKKSESRPGVCSQEQAKPLKKRKSFFSSSQKEKKKYPPPSYTVHVPHVDDTK